MNHIEEIQEAIIHANHLDFAVKTWNMNSAKHSSVILALHGWLDNAASFDLLAPLLKDYKIVAVDQCGHGKSQHRPLGVPYHFVDYVADAFYIADALKLDKFILLGHSMGANVATMMAGVIPERIQALLLIEGFGPATRSADQTCNNLRESIEKFSAANSRKKRYARFSSLVKARLQGRWKLTEQAASRLCERGSVEQDGLFTWSSDPRINYTSPIKMTAEQAGFIRSEVNCPTQIIVAEEGIAPQLSPDTAPLNEFRHATVTRLPGYHHLHMDETYVGDVAACLNQFLEQKDLP